MSTRHPIIAVTGSSGAGRDIVRQVFDAIFRRERLTAAYVKGESFHRHTRAEMRRITAERLAAGDDRFSHFGAEANLFEEQETLYRSYGATGAGRRRHYLHSATDVAQHGNSGLRPGEFTPWEDLPADTDLLVYKGLHGVVRGDGFDLGKLVDLKIGMVPVINLEWMRKVHKDTNERGYSPEAVVETVLRRMNDYVRTVVPQFKHSDVNFQQVPVVDTSAPLIARDLPSIDESVTVVRFRKPEDFVVNFPQLLSRIEGSWMSRRNTIVLPGGKTNLAMELVFTPIIHQLMDRKRLAADAA
ncbi:MAG: phosphoribulokinase [Phaeospirillum sp.]|nr:phosphoribulokinase [Phaeospirillum sp.]